MDPVVVALQEQLDELASLVEGLDEDQWRGHSGCSEWSISDVVLHLAQSNELATASARGRLKAFAGGADWSSAGADVDRAADEMVMRQRGASGAEVFARWRRSADDMVDAFAEAEPDVRVEWVVGDMAPRTLVTTRIAETWIHTRDVAVGLGVALRPTARLRHIAHLVHRTVPYAFERAELPSPAPVAFELTPPDGSEPWVFGDPATAANVVRGPALDLCLVAGQRRLAEDSALSATGPEADEVLTLMRTFA